MCSRLRVIAQRMCGTEVHTRAQLSPDPCIMDWYSGTHHKIIPSNPEVTFTLSSQPRLATSLTPERTAVAFKFGTGDRRDFGAIFSLVLNNCHLLTCYWCYDLMLCSSFHPSGVNSLIYFFSLAEMRNLYLLTGYLATFVLLFHLS
ncbi:hypothetical protein BDQ17DRAFT_450047 [Cyathus striatus]|nr:hypothetical protein BDQ17DRAFT_450047 [Cyathus striatus]